MANKIKKKRFPVKPKEQGAFPWLVDHQGNIYDGGGILGALTRANKAMDASKLGGLMGGASGISGIAGGIASAASNAVSGGMSTGVGGAMQTIGGLASNIPGVGGLIGAGVNVLGGVVNKAFGSQINDQFVADTKQAINEVIGKQFDSSSIDSVLSQQGSYQDMNLVNKDDVGKDGWFSSKAKDLAKSLNKQIQFANTYNRDKLDTAFANADEQQDLSLLANYSAYGGPLFANGGFLGTHGGDFSNGITIVGNGGTHEENPFEGVQMGLDPQGVPNLVEEGEVVFNDYVFSNRLKVPKKDRKRLRLKEGTFADAAEKLQKESAERPNDPISRRGLEASMNRLAGIQEGVRERKSGNKFAKGGPLGVEEDYILPNYTNQNRLAMSFLDKNPMAVMSKEGTITTPASINKQNTTQASSNNDSGNGMSPTWMRYAPAVGSALGVFSDAIGLTNTPDYAPAEMIGEAITPVKPVGARQISNRLTYKPLDTNYELNKLDANQAAQRRALINTSGGNRATAAANLIAANANYGNQMGDLHRQAELYNQQQRQQVEGFNRGTNQFNAEAQMRADLANAQQAQQMNELRLRQKSAQAQMYDTANMRSSAGRAANLTNLFDNLGGIGQENFSRNMINSNSALLYALSNMGGVDYKKNKKKKGGRLTYGR